jgi:TonB family protein
MNTKTEYSRSPTSTSRSSGRIGLFCGLVLLLGYCAEARASIQVVVHSSSSISSMSREAVARLFLRKDVTWSIGGKVIPVDQAPGSAVRDAFSKAVCKRETRHIQSYWAQQFISGTAVPPVELANDDAVLEFVRTSPGAIGYVSERANIQGVKVLQIIEAGEGQTVTDYPFLTENMIPPRLLEITEPRYPRAASLTHYECSLTVRVKIDSNGRVRDVNIVTPCDKFQQEFNDSALKSVPRYVYAPALDSEGRPTPVSYIFDISFEL